MPDVDAAPTRKSRKGCWIALSVVALAIVGVGTFYGPAVADFLKVYGIESLTKPERHKYRASSEGNLKAIYQSLILHHDSEGQFPDAKVWMDSIENRLKTNDLAKGEEKKKLIRPDLLGKPNKYGYAINEQVAGKYIDDVPNPSQTPLIYESKQEMRNAFGDPATDRDGIAIAVDGTILQTE